MNCMKCGKETAEGQSFCTDCLEVMEAYPVKPGTPIQILPRPAANERRSPPRSTGPTPAEQVSHLRRTIRWLYLMIAVLSVLLCITGVLLIQTLNHPQETPDIGKNYTATTGAKP